MVPMINGTTFTFPQCIIPIYYRICIHFIVWVIWWKWGLQWIICFHDVPEDIIKQGTALSSIDEDVRLSAVSVAYKFRYTNTFGTRNSYACMLL